MGQFYCEAGEDCQCDGRASGETWRAAWLGYYGFRSRGTVFFVNGECKPDGAVVLSTVCNVDGTWHVVRVLTLDRILRGDWGGEVGTEKRR